MIHLPESLAAWRTPAFRDTLRRELAGLPARAFALERFVSAGDRALAEDLGFDVRVPDPEAPAPTAHIAVFFDVQVQCCSCGDEPVLEAGCAWFTLRIDPRDASASLTPLL
ncbi:MAG: hypothetical protein D6721_07240 [Gammaproteobacteria bacterium]|nr:MAG: hypothetical protein D6721_07240 [Gammaproteobacteria bacterium]